MKSLSEFLTGTPAEGIPPNFSLPTHDEDCECIHICEKLGGTYDMCHKGANALISDRCSIETRQLLLHQDAQTPSKLKKLVSFLERITLWLVAIGGFALALYANFK